MLIAPNNPRHPLSSPRELPPPPPGCVGWPWTSDAADPEPNVSPSLPKITVVTPSYNQAAFLEKTIRSVLLQRYPRLQYIIMDGGSSDGSADIIRRYAPWLDHWESTKDRGQSHAINKGLSMAAGDVVCWLNSDDYFTPRTLFKVGEFFHNTPTAHALVGDMTTVDQHGNQLQHYRGGYQHYRQLAEFWKGYSMHQPAIFWRKGVHKEIGGLDESEHLAMDFELWLRIARVYDFHYLPKTLATAHVHMSAKTGTSFAPYRRRQLACVLKKHVLPSGLRHLSVTWSLYKHLFKQGVLTTLGRNTFYNA